MRRVLIPGALVLVGVLALTLVNDEDPAAHPGVSTTSPIVGAANSTEVTATSERCKVTGPEAQRELVQQLADLCVPSAKTVDEAWGTAWAQGSGQRTRLVIAGSVDDLADLLNRNTTKGLDETAAVTVGPDNSPAHAVYVNGVGFQELSDLGRQVVLTHELVHVASRATGDSAAPTWLEEGYADYVAYRDTDLLPRQIAGDALAAPLPEILPSKDDFDAAGPDAAVAYGRSWAAAMLLADRLGGDAAFRTFYTTAAHAGVGEALRTAGFGDAAAFVDAWRQEIRALREAR